MTRARGGPLDSVVFRGGERIPMSMASDGDGVPKDNGLDAPWLMEHGSSHETAPQDDGPEVPTQPAGSSSASVHVNGGEEWANGSMREASMSRISFFVSSSRWVPSPVCWSPLQIRRKHCFLGGSWSRNKITKPRRGCGCIGAKIFSRSYVASGVASEPEGVVRSKCCVEGCMWQAPQYALPYRDQSSSSLSSCDVALIKKATTGIRIEHLRIHPRCFTGRI